MLVPVADRFPAVDLEGISPGRRHAQPTQGEPQPQARRLRRRLFQRPDQGQQLRRTRDQVAQRCRFRFLGDIVEQSRVARANRLDVDSDWCQGHRGNTESVRVTDRAGETRLRCKVWPAVRPVGNCRARRWRGPTSSQVRVGLPEGEPSTQPVGQPIVEDARHHLFTDATNGHALG
jgi:hypothetical protein